MAYKISLGTIHFHLVRVICSYLSIRRSDGFNVIKFCWIIHLNCLSFISIKASLHFLDLSHVIQGLTPLISKKKKGDQAFIVVMNMPITFEN